MSAAHKVLTRRWTQLRFHEAQRRMWESRARFIIAHAGRRSGKTEIWKRKIVIRAMARQKFEDAWYICAGPTHAQAKRIFWRDLKKLIPRWAITKISESELTITLVNGARITVLGLDRADRIEGDPIDGIVIDEFGSLKPDVWFENIRPALATPGRPGWAALIGVPEGRNFYYRLKEKAEGLDDWEVFHWHSKEILDKKEIDDAMRDMDPLTYEQEMGGKFVTFEGRAYYPFDRSLHTNRKISYDPDKDLVFCFDFNVAPGVAVVVQELEYEGTRQDVPGIVTCCIDEVHIPQNSNTPAVCRKLVEKYGTHTGNVYCYGDATGGAKGSAKVKGSDWDLVKLSLQHVFQDKVDVGYGVKVVDRLFFNVPRGNPRERARINAVNTRLLSGDKKVRLLINSKKCPNLISDLDGVVLLAGGSGEIDKKYDRSITHLSDALGYFIVREHPIHAADSIGFKQVA